MGIHIDWGNKEDGIVERYVT